MAFPLVVALACGSFLVPGTSSASGSNRAQISETAAALAAAAMDDFAAGTVDSDAALDRVELAVRLRAAGETTGTNPAPPRSARIWHVELLRSLDARTSAAVAAGRMTDAEALGTGQALARAVAAQCAADGDGPGELRALREAADKGTARQAVLQAAIPAGRSDRRAADRAGWEATRDRAALARREGRKAEVVTALQANVAAQEAATRTTAARVATGLAPTFQTAESSASVAGARAALAAETGDKAALTAALAERVECLREVCAAEKARARVGTTPLLQAGQSVVRLAEASRDLARVRNNASDIAAARDEAVARLKELATLAASLEKSGLIRSTDAAVMDALLWCAANEPPATKPAPSGPSR